MPGRLYGLTWFSEEIVRARRSDWNFDTPQLLAEELYTIIKYLRDQDAERVTIEGDTVEEITNEDIDTVFPPGTQPPIPLPPGDPEFQTIVRTRWTRDPLPCKVGAQESGNVYACTLYPYGDMIPLKATDPPSDTATGDLDDATDLITDVKYLQMDIDEDEVIPEGTFVLASYMQQWKITQEYRDGALINEIWSVLQRRAFGQVPIWLE